MAVIPGKIQRGILATIMVTTAAGFLYLGIVRYVAYRSAHEGTREGILRAIKLVPDNAQYHYAYGRLLAIVDQDPERSIPEFKEAVRLNPHSSQYWLGLAMAAQMTGREKDQKEALDEAVRVDPTTPLVSNEVANYYLFKGNVPKALSLFKAQLSQKAEPELKDGFLDTAWKATGGDGKLILQLMIPNPPEDRLRFLTYCEARKFEAAHDVWEELVKESTLIDEKHAAEYVTLALKLKKWPEAVAAWEQWVRQGHDDYRRADGIVHGNFEADTLIGGFDWRIDVGRDVALISVDTTDFHGGNSSIAVEYQTTTVQGPYVLSQFVPVKSSTRYFLHFWTKSTELSSAAPPRIEIVDADNHQELGAAGETRGTTAWHEQTLEFGTGPSTTMVIIQISSAVAGKHIGGTLKLDDFRLVAADSDLR
jgi:tetratricopeptide (TPR) repeat protein